MLVQRGTRLAGRATARLATRWTTSRPQSRSQSSATTPVPLTDVPPDSIDRGFFDSLGSEEMNEVDFDQWLNSLWGPLEGDQSAVFPTE